GFQTKILFPFNRNKKLLLIFFPLLILIIWFFLVLYTLSKVPFSHLSMSLGTGLVGSHVYFIHGYNGNDSQFSDMVAYLNSTDFFDNNPYKKSPLFFNYYEKYYNLGLTKTEIHNIEGGISTYAEDFYDQLCKTHESAEIDIVAHSLGGLIVREMLHTHRRELELSGIKILRVITLGTPHLGTELVNHPLTKQILWFCGLDYETIIEQSLTPGSAFLTHLNQDPASYMEDIEWYFIAGVSLHPLVLSFQEIIFNGVPCDGLVDCESALAVGLDFEPVNRIILQKDHEQLICDPQNHVSYEYINKWLSIKS
ncbi:MAG: esterase/lipase family protein, partial [Candidatus Hodarchaeota archaeon]